SIGRMFGLMWQKSPLERRTSGDLCSGPELRVLAACGIWSDSLTGATASIQAEGIRRPAITVRTGEPYSTQEKRGLQVNKTHWSPVHKLWEDSHFILSRETPPGGSESLLVLAPTSERPSPATIRQLEYLHSLREKLDSA